MYCKVVQGMQSTIVFKNLRDFLTVGEAAAMLGICDATLRSWDRSGKLKATRHPLNGYRLYRKSEIESFLSRLNHLPQA
jgi:excisionase family DNA binding protein